MLDREEYIEQAHFFRMLAERNQMGVSTQDLLGMVREEILSTTKLPMAIDFLAGELKLIGVFHTAMAKLSHYFTPFQTFVISEAERDAGGSTWCWHLQSWPAKPSTGPAARRRREFSVRVRIAGAQPAGLRPGAGGDRRRPDLRRGLARVDPDRAAPGGPGRLCRSDLRAQRALLSPPAWPAHGASDEPANERPVLFGEGEGRIALANRGKDPLLLFNALHRHLGYPEVPRPAKPDESPQLVPQLLRRVERLEARLKLVEEELKGGIDLTRFYAARRRGEEPAK